MNVVIGITGASGTVYAHTLLKNLNVEETHLIISDTGKSLIEYELDIALEDIFRLADYHYDNSDLSAKISSGSVKYDAMVIIPCSTSSLAKITAGIADNLITRVADVCLKEHRKLGAKIEESDPLWKVKGEIPISIDPELNPKKVIKLVTNRESPEGQIITRIMYDN